MRTHFFPATDRGLKDIGWLKSHLTFSFGPYASPERNGFGLLKVFNDDYVAPTKGFGLHAHANMEIISVLLAGTMNHKDSLGYSEVIPAGGVQIMSAGSGIRHEEYNVGDDEVNFLQIWIEPKLQNVTPRYQRRQFPEDKRANRLTTIVSNEEGTAHCWINQNAKLSLGYYTETQGVDYQFAPANKMLYVFVISGTVRVGDQVLGTRDALGIWEGPGRVHLDCAADTRFLVIEAPINH